MLTVSHSLNTGEEYTQRRSHKNDNNLKPAERYRRIALTLALKSNITASDSQRRDNAFRQHWRI